MQGALNYDVGTVGFVGLLGGIETRDELQNLRPLGPVPQRLGIYSSFV